MEFFAKSLDLAWFVVAAVAVIRLGMSEVHQPRKRGRIRRVLVVLLALIVLFPSLSARDDLFGLAFLTSRANQHNQPAIEVQAVADIQLGNQLLALDHILVTSFHVLSMNIRFAARVPSAISPLQEHAPVRQFGRAPPII
jgi:hypothetical protein